MYCATNFESKLLFDNIGVRLSLWELMKSKGTMLLIKSSYLTFPPKNFYLQYGATFFLNYPTIEFMYFQYMIPDVYFTNI